jgi:hypothetical protein
LVHERLFESGSTLVYCIKATGEVIRAWAEYVKVMLVARRRAAKREGISPAIARNVGARSVARNGREIARATAAVAKSVTAHELLDGLLRCARGRSLLVAATHAIRDGEHTTRERDA